MFYSLFHFIIDVFKTVDSGLCLYIHMIMENNNGFLKVYRIYLIMSIYISLFI